MKIKDWRSLHNFFKFSCILTTLALIIWCCYEFNKNEDVCEVLFKTFHEDQDSIYPEITFGVINRFNETALNAHNASFNAHNYRNFLQGGDQWDEKMVEIDFKEVSMKLKDYEIETCLIADAVSYRDGICNNDSITIRRLNTLEWALFTLHLPSNMPMFSATIKLKNSIFYGGIRPATDKFLVTFGYPHQIYRSMPSAFFTWPLRNNASTKHYKMKFFLKSLEVLRRRQKMGKQCYDKQNYDREIVQTIQADVGCTPIWWLSNRSEPMCRTRESFQKINAESTDQIYRLTKDKKYLDPCLDIQKIQIDYVEENIPSVGGTSDDDDEGWFILEFFVLTNKFKEIKQVRKYSVQSLVGNLGGYIGLCLGYALMSLPSVILEIWRNIKDICLSK